ANNLWSTPQNWVGDVAPHAGDDLVFGSAAQKTNVNDFAAGTAFRSSALNDSGYLISGNAIAISAGVIGNQVSGSTIALDMILTTSQTFSLVSAAGYTLSGNIDLNGKTLTA